MKYIKGYHFHIHTHKNKQGKQLNIYTTRKPYLFYTSDRTKHHDNMKPGCIALVKTSQGAAKLAVTEILASRGSSKFGTKPVVLFCKPKPIDKFIVKAVDRRILRGKKHGMTSHFTVKKEADKQC